MRARVPISRVEARVYRIPTDAPESDGTFRWTSTTLVLAQVSAGSAVGLGYTYSAGSTAALIRELLAPVLTGCDAVDISRCAERMLHAIRNVGRPGLCATAISAVDSALWDLKARLLDVALVDLLGASRDAVPIYGSGGFTSYDETRLTDQLARWIEAGITRVKMKIGSGLDLDVQRVRAVHERIGRGARLMVDANGAYEVKETLQVAEHLREFDVVWYEEPVSSDDLVGLRLIRDRAPAGMAIAAGEYGYDEYYFRRMLEAQAVDILQADATRCCGITGFLKADALASAFQRPLSSHCAPALHVHVCCAAPSVRHLEYFHDHVRIERELFDGVIEPRDGLLRPDRSRIGNGLTLREDSSERFRVAPA
jgi:L-alanine-DL-glutamate epimerase-like enolase superfamily enzyme